MVVGCGSQLAFKILRDVLLKEVVAISDSLKDHISPIGDCLFMKNPLVSEFIIVADEQTVEKNLASVVKSNSLIICCNKSPKQRFAKILGEYGYSATASIDSYEDYKNKINKAMQLSGLRFIEVLSPCPQEWGYDTSLTVHVSRDAVEAGIWPLYEIEKKKVVLGKRPEKMGILEPFHGIQNKYKFEQKLVEDNWKHLVQLSLI